LTPVGDLGGFEMTRDKAGMALLVGWVQDQSQLRELPPPLGDPAVELESVRQLTEATTQTPGST